MAEKEKATSKYAMKHAARRRADGGSEHPMPRPLDPDYIAKHNPRYPHHTVMDEKAVLRPISYFQFGAIPFRHKDGSMSYKMPEIRRA